MTPEQFVYWLQGYMEIENPEKLGKKQLQIVKDHLSLVFDKQTPDRSSDTITIEDLKPLDYTITCSDTTSHTGTTSLGKLTDPKIDFYC